MKHQYGLVQRLGLLLLVGLVSACALPSTSVPGPTPPMRQRVLVPTATSPTEPAAFTTTSSPSNATTTDVKTAATTTTNDTTVATSELTPSQAALLAKLPSRGAAPELDNATWFNSAPLKLTDLRGKVVIVEFWTYG
ncbi:MAG: hypothetical protein KDE19_24355 [Caldilineaceae bacterium]|nr:hypothetical protein [Caldilineaceae bacterium]